MTIKEAIEKRRSRRKYLKTPINHSSITKLKELIDEYNKKENLRIELIRNNGKAFNGLRKSYGMFSGVDNYIGLIANKKDKASSERLGYYGELLVLNAEMLGLGTCWVGGTFSRSSCPFSLSEDEMIVCTIVIGNVDEQDSLKEKLIRNITHRKTKSIEEMLTTDGPVPDWVMDGMKAVQKAPSAVNRQPVSFSYRDGKVIAKIKAGSDHSMAIDFGIAKLHFEIGSGGGKWGWGNGSEFVRGVHRN